MFVRLKLVVSVATILSLVIVHIATVGSSLRDYSQTSMAIKNNIKEKSEEIQINTVDDDTQINTDDDDTQINTDDDDTQHTNTTEEIESSQTKDAIKTEKEPTSSDTSSFLTMYGEHRVQPALENLPKWFTDYFEWHRNETKNANKDTKYLILSCSENDMCGGVSDRLRAISIYPFIASRTKRVFCIHWDKPFRLQTFLQPPVGGMDWRCPDSFDNSNPEIATKRIFLFRNMSLKESIQKAIDTIKTREEDRFQTIASYTTSFTSMNLLNQFVHSYSYKEKMPVLGGWTHIHLMEHMFRVMFEPIEVIARNINATMKELGLVENEYTTVHLRNQYPSDELDRILKIKSSRLDLGYEQIPFDGGYKKYSLALARNALECGQLLASNNNTPIFFITDEIELLKDLTSETPSFTLTNKESNTDGNATKTDTTTSTTTTRQKVVYAHKSRKKQLPHFDSNKLEDYQDFFPLFEDLLIMGGGQCVSHGVGGFGAFGASLASGNRCRNIHRNFKNGDPRSCPNGRSEGWIMNVTENMLLSGDRIMSENDGRLDPAEGTIIDEQALKIWGEAIYKQLEE